MKGFVCGDCGHISIKGAAPEKCPVCKSQKKGFEERDVIKTAKDEGPGEKHVPVIKVVKKCGLIGEGCIDAHVKIGKVTHPMEPEHFITLVDFYIDKEWVSRVKLSPALNPAAGAHIKAESGKLTAIELCNLHGYWINEVDI